MELQTRIGAAVRRLRRERDWTQGELASRVGEVLDEAAGGGSLTKPNYLSELEKGKRPIGLDHIAVLSEALGVDPLAMLSAAFTVTPRGAEQAVQSRQEAFDRALEAAYFRLDERFLQGIDGPLGQRAVQSIGTIGMLQPDDLETVVLQLEGLAAARMAQTQPASAGAIAWGDMDAEGRANLIEVLAALLVLLSIPLWRDGPQALAGRAANAASKGAGATDEVGEGP